MTKSVAVILSGCGVYDGAEINESVLTLLALEEQGIAYQCFAPDINQYHVINHLTGETVKEVRNVLNESARIVRGNVKALSTCNASEFVAVVIPGGFGVVKNLSNFAFKGTDAEINAELLSVLREFINVKKLVAAMCIAPALLPKIYGRRIALTVGSDEETASAINKMGGEHVNATVSEVVFDEVNQLLTTPAYMLAKNIVEAKSGIDALITHLAKIIK